MITADFTYCKTLTEFYEEIRMCHENAHGHEYTDHHREMRRLFLEEGISSYRELGIMQGATAACAAVYGAKKLHLIDIDVSRFTPYFPLFKNIDIVVSKASSHDFNVNKLEDVDLLLIDTLHNAKHVEKELNIFAPSTRKYIILHDTYAVESIQKMIENSWLPNNPEWKLAKYHKRNVGYTLLERKAK